ncbi:MAG: hypothetical protein KF766_00570 [Rhodocyclaceae bacterium]|nr:hypothetical protein [Rhodocyclaceae bacterium]MCP5296058.1 hypothetical protein [Zoogloeaceae bacterium]
MARIVLSTEVIQLVHILFAELSQLYRETVLPVLVVRWSSGTKENRRGPNGESIWETIEPPGWLAHVSPWGESDHASITDNTIVIDDIRLLLDQRAKGVDGILHITSTDRTLHVEHKET